MRALRFTGQDGQNQEFTFAASAAEETIINLY
jgi:hypothetical protein